MMKEKAQTLVTDQLYNLVAGFLYALSICYFAKLSLIHISEPTRRS